MKEQAPKESIAEKTRAYIDAHPSIKDCISKLLHQLLIARQIDHEGPRREERGGGG